MKPKENYALNKPVVKCGVCGCFMRRLKLLEKVRLGLLPGTNYTHICKRSRISYETGVMKHE